MTIHVHVGYVTHYIGQGDRLITQQRHQFHKVHTRTFTLFVGLSETMMNPRGFLVGITVLSWHTAINDHVSRQLTLPRVREIRCIDHVTAETMPTSDIV